MKKLILVVIAFTISSTPLWAKISTYGPPEGRTKILIAYEETKFKTLLIKKMVETLNDGKVFIKVLDHEKDGLTTEKAADYSAVFISNSGVKSMVRPWVTLWISKQPLKNNILLHTTQKNFWEVKAEVDTVTSASATQAIDVLSRKYIDKINKILKKKL